MLRHRRMQQRRAMRTAVAVLALSILGGPVAAQDASPAPGASVEPDRPTAGAFEAIIPTELAGVELERLSYSGDDLAAGADEDDPIAELTALAEANGATISDLFVASGSSSDDGVFVGVLAATISGVPAARFADELTPLILELGPDVTMTNEVIAEREVIRVGPGSGLTGEAPVFVFEQGEVVWYVVADHDLLEQVIGAMP